MPGSDGSITYNFAGISNDAGELHGVVGKVNGLLTEGESALARLAGSWEGEANLSYSEAQQRWNQNSTELNLALQSLGQAVEQCGGDMGQCEMAGVNRFM